MRLNITSKLFLGFLFVILLNAIYVVIVNKITALNSVTTILKKQDMAKNEILQVARTQSDRRRSRTAFEAIGKIESIENFKQSGTEIAGLLDTIQNELREISGRDTSLFKKRISNVVHCRNNNRIRILLDTIVNVSTIYDSTFLRIIAPASPLDSLHNMTDSMESLRAVFLDTADRTMANSLTMASNILDEQTKIVIKDAERRITEIRQMTIIILIIVILVAVGFAFFFSRAVTNSLRRLKESASLIGKGNFAFDPSGYPADEIGDLANAFHDMATDLKHAQEELVKSKRLAAIGEVVASVNHEINNPLMIISGNAQFLEMSMTNASDDTKERIKVILEETERISDVTKRLREIRNPIVENYTTHGEKMINLDKSSTLEA